MIIQATNIYAMDSGRVPNTSYWGDLRNTSYYAHLDNNVLGCYLGDNNNQYTITRGLMTFDVSAISSIPENASVKLKVKLNTLQGTSISTSTVSFWDGDLSNQDGGSIEANRFSAYLQSQTRLSDIVEVSDERVYTFTLNDNARQSIISQQNIWHPTLINEDYDWGDTPPPPIQSNLIGVYGTDLASAQLVIENLPKPLSLENWSNMNGILRNNIEKINS
ncbi:hypothetical protein [Mesonia aestuariivivens]|uniref:Uncharacterized protein n=1 Tax=Mesonia aestuariivivens TaxID=2796128 RepID=A0ABS6W371_9FLAO|nr:hypothetical protein [Mesonia aestuariivivens]MBW2962317.1 hypothetical protein [Mesonia aestuariivivens]